MSQIEAPVDRQLQEHRKKVSNETLGSSSHRIIEALVKCQGELPLSQNSSILDVGCGQGHLLQRLAEERPQTHLTGMDLQKFKELEALGTPFIQHDLNESFPADMEVYDLVIVNQVILYIENSWQFLREVSRCVRPGGYLIVSEPNIESFRSLTSFFFRGYHFCCPPRYPGHITVKSMIEMKRIITATGCLNIEKIDYVNDGMIPGVGLDWRNIIPGIKGRRFSDTYLIVAKKV